MRKYLQRGLCIVLCVVMAFSFAVVPAGAVVIAPLINEAAKFVGVAVAAWCVEKGVEFTLQTLWDFATGKSDDTDGLLTSISALDSSATRTELSHDYLRQLSYEWNHTCADAVGFVTQLIEYKHSSGQVYGVIVARINRGIASTYLADGTGRILYCNLTEETSGHWESEDDAMSTRYLLSYVDLYNLCNEVGGLLRIKDGFYEIYNRRGEIYCNTAGFRFSCIYKADQTAVNQDRPTTGGTIIEGDTITNIENTYNEDNDTVVNNDYSQDIDIESMTQFLPGSTQNVIDNLIYDDNTKTYYVDSHDETNNITQNYVYEYHINYTSITYIGQTEEYNKRYELYYQLPDGRDSADLTLEELEQLNVDIDVIPYARSTDNVDVRSLYHFDGDTRDSSYWNNETSFEWQAGASLTYMESGAFEGALYLDENAHAFKMTLPRSGDAALDWTLQFRYYQSYTPAPEMDSYLDVGGDIVLWMDGRTFYDLNKNPLAVIPTGSWNEVCIIRSGGLLYYYVNGVCYGSAEDANRHSSDISFLFGSGQQTNKQIDELRFTRGAVYTPGANYTPTSVPHDSNLTLVLPEGSEVIVDEVIRITNSENLLTAQLRDDWSVSGIFNNLERSYTPYNPISTVVDTSTYTSVMTGYPMVYDRDIVKAFTSSDHSYEGRRVEFGGTKWSSLQNSTWQPQNSIHLPLFWRYMDEDGDYWRTRSGLIGDWKSDTVYTFSVVLEDGLYSSVTFQIVSDSDCIWALDVLSTSINSDIQFECDMFLGPFSYEYEIGGILWNSTSGSALVRYTELVEGSVSQFEVEYDTAVYVKEALQDPPILAVRTDIDITDHQIGGVRPSVPEKGQVWALVESGYITSLQVYNGSLWENCDGRIWTGSRWIPASSYNVITLQDMFDIVDSTQDYEYIYTESGFWSWFQKAWKDLISRLDQIIEGQISGQYDPSKYECQHVYDRTVDCAATCTDYGRHVFFCTECGDTVEVLLDPIGHDWPLDLTAFSIYRQPQSVTAPVGSTATFRVLATGDGLQYQWSYLGADGTWYKSPAQGSQTNTLSIPVTQNRDGNQYRCKITDSSGAVLYSDSVTLTVGAAVEPVPVEGLTCTRCGAAGEYDGERIIGPDGAPDEDLRVDVILLDVFNGAWSIVTGFISTGFNGLSGFINSLSSIPSFFDLYRPGNSAGVLGLFNYGGDDIWD